MRPCTINKREPFCNMLINLKNKHAKKKMEEKKQTLTVTESLFKGVYAEVLLLDYTRLALMNCVCGKLTKQNKEKLFNLVRLTPPVSGTVTVTHTHYEHHLCAPL